MGTLGRKPALAPLRVDDIPDGAGSGLDADLLDGQQGNSFVLVSEKAAVNGVATLDSAGKIPAGQLPSISISSVNVVADNTERDGLTVQTGDLAKVTSTGLTFVFDGSAWVEIVAAYPVDSVNGQTGVVTLTTDDVGEGSTNKYYSSTLANADIDARVDKTFVDALNVDADTVDGAGLNDAGSGALDLWSAQKISSEIGSLAELSFVFTAAGGETSVTQDDGGSSVSYTVGFVEVYLNGVRLVEGADYTASDGSSVSGLAPLVSGDVVEVVSTPVTSVLDTVSAASGGEFFGDVTVPNLRVADGGTIGSVSDADAITVAAGGATTFSQLVTASSGISFGADTLDDYEEGTWTPVIQSGTTDAVGVYIKTGNVVHWWVHVLTSSTSGGSSALWTLPFTVTQSGGGISGARGIGNTSWQEFTNRQLGVLTSNSLPDNKFRLNDGNAGLSYTDVNGIRFFASGSFTTA